MIFYKVKSKDEISLMVPQLYQTLMTPFAFFLERHMKEQTFVGKLYQFAQIKTKSGCQKVKELLTKMICIYTTFHKVFIKGEHL